MKFKPSNISTRYPHKPIVHPATPANTSPTPWLTSVHSTVTRGKYGSGNYRGNCSGYLIKDLLRFFGASRVLDPMTGSGTCKDVCDELDIECHSFDLKDGHDANDWQSYKGIGKFDFVWLHPPYWQMIRYNDDSRCLSNAPTLESFSQQLREVLEKCTSVMTANGHIAILIGNYQHKGRYIPLTYLTFNVATQLGLWPASTDVIRLQHNNASSKKSYNSSFIPAIHDVCLIFEKEGTSDKL